MASEHVHHGIEAAGLDCAVCGYDPVVVRDDHTVESPACDESFSLVVHEGFALVESDGWIARVAVDPVEDLPGAVPG